MLGDTVNTHEVGKHLHRILGSDTSRRIDGQALPRVLIDHHHELNGTPILGSLEHEVPRPHMIGTFRSQPDA